MANLPRNHRSWRLILGDGRDAGRDDAGRASADGPTNMAIDHALLASVAAGAAPVLRLYRWSPATLSFGRNQPARGLYDEAAAADRGIAFVRRPTGGQAVLHDDELTYAVVAPIEAVGKPRAAYRVINEALVAALRELGVAAAVAPGNGRDRGSAAARAWSEACFRRPERGEVVVGGRKLVGSAQRMESRTILQHGSILLGGSQAAAEELLVERAVPSSAGTSGGGSAVAAEGGWTTVSSELGRRPAPDALEAAVARGFERVLGIRLARSALVAEERSAARELRRRFEATEWTWRR